MTSRNDRGSSEGPFQSTNSFFPSPGSTSPLPVAHWSNITAYISDGIELSRRMRRPQPPTHRKMAPQNRSTSTAIPRPASGTSRRLTSIQKPTKSCLIPLLSPEKARRPSQPGPNRDKKATPPSSFHLPRSLIPQSESLLNSFEEGGSLRPTANPTRAVRGRYPGIPKSRTTPALLSPNKDIASCSLLRPIGPHLRRSSTTSDVSVYASLISPNEFCPSTTGMVPTNTTALNSNNSPNITSIRNSAYPSIDWANESFASSTQLSIGEKEVDPRFVFTYEVASYWAGRYIALLDRLRSRIFISPPDPGDGLGRDSVISETTKILTRNTEFAMTETNIESEAVAVLRSYCQTEAASESFERFTYLVHKRQTECTKAKFLPLTQDKPSVDNSRGKASRYHAPTGPSTTKAEKRMLSGSFPSRMFRKSSSTQPQVKARKLVVTEPLSESESYLSPGAPVTTTDLAYDLVEPRSKYYSASMTEENLPSLQGTDDILKTASLQTTRDTREISNFDKESTIMPLAASSSDRLNREASCNFSHRDLKQTLNMADEKPPLKTTSDKLTRTCVPESTSYDSSRRFRKSDSIMQLVDYGIREMKKISKKRSVSEAVNETSET